MLLPSKIKYLHVVSKGTDWTEGEDVNVLKIYTPDELFCGRK